MEGWIGSLEHLSKCMLIKARDGRRYLFLPFYYVRSMACIGGKEGFQRRKVGTWYRLIYYSIARNTGLPIIYTLPKLYNPDAML